MFCCFSWEKLTKSSRNPGLVNQFSATLRGQLNWTGPIANGSNSLGFEERSLGCPGNFAGMSRTPGSVQKVCAKRVRAHFSGKKKEPKPKLLGPDILGWGGGLPREGGGGKKFGMSLETREIKLFWRDIPGFCRPEKFEKKSLGSIFVP